jgi:hypothetical protein
MWIQIKSLSLIYGNNGIQTRTDRWTHQTNHQTKDDTEVRTIKESVRQKESK